MWNTGIPITDDLRERFASEFLRLNKDQYKAGAAIWPSDPNKGVALGMELAADPKTKQIIADLLNTKGPRAFLPTKEEAAAEIWAFATDKAVHRDAKDRLSAFRLFCDVMGFIEKAPANNINLGVVNNKVMVVQSYGSDDEWEQAALAQQRQLTYEADAA